MKSLLAFSILFFCSMVQAKTGFVYTALAFHPASPDYYDYMPNRLDERAAFVRLPLYFALNNEWSANGSNYLTQWAYFENCYLRPSVEFTHAIKFDDFSTKNFSFYYGATVYAREKPQVLIDGNLTQIDDIPLELTSGRYGLTVFPTLLVTYQLTDFARLDVGYSGISLVQLSWTFGK